MSTLTQQADPATPAGSARAAATGVLACTRPIVMGGYTGSITPVASCAVTGTRRRIVLRSALPGIVAGPIAISRRHPE